MPLLQVEKDIQRELDAEKPQGEEALNNLFKQIYGKVGLLSTWQVFNSNGATAAFG